MIRSTPLALAALLAGCPTPPEPAEPGPLEHVFTFVVFADPHVVNEGENLQRTRAAVDWVAAEADARAIELVIVVGDVGWGDVGMELARGALDDLPMPYVPLIGDNEVQTGGEEHYDAVFGPRFDGLEPSFGGFDRAPTPVFNPEHDVDSWFQNLTFEHRGVTFVGMDWGTRHIGGLVGESADLHDFDGGTWRHFERWLADLPEGRDNDVVLASHHPMHLSPGAFSMVELDRIYSVTGPLTDRLYGAFAGHYHFDAEEWAEDGSYQVFVTDAIWDDDNTVRVVEVWGNEVRFDYRHELVIIE